MTAKITKVLLIEDNPGDARLLEAMLAQTGGSAFTFTVEVAERLATGQPVMNESTGTSRRPRAPATSAVAPSAASAVGQSAAGSACARLPPIVPRFRTARYEMFAATAAMK